MTAHRAFLDRRTFISLNGLRGIAVLAVVWQHTGAKGGLLSMGYYGVDLFFAISGFLITTLLLREWSRNGTIDLPKFYARRSLRIFPLYFGTLALYVALVLLTQLHTVKGQEFVHNIPAFLSYTSNWFVPQDGEGTIFYFAWSLATEEQFYLGWPPLLVLALSFARPAIAAGALALVGTADILASLWGGTSMLSKVPASIATAIVVGSLLAMALHRGHAFAVLRLRWVQLAVAGLTVGLMQLHAPRPLVGTVMAVLVASACVNEVHWLTWRPLAHVGTVSYGVYLLHMLCANVVRPLAGGKGPLLFAATTVLVLLVASASYRWFETPILRHKIHWQTNPEAVTA